MTYYIPNQPPPIPQFQETGTQYPAHGDAVSGSSAISNLNSTTTGPLPSPSPSTELSLKTSNSINVSSLIDFTPSYNPVAFIPAFTKKQKTSLWKHEKTVTLISLRTSKYAEALEKAGKNSKEIRRLWG